MAIFTALAGLSTTDCLGGDTIRATDDAFNTDLVTLTGSMTPSAAKSPYQGVRSAGNGG